MPSTSKTIAILNGTGRQAASVIRAVSAVGYIVRAQVFSREGLVAEELGQIQNVTLFEGSLLDNAPLLDALFSGAQFAFINTISQAGDEVKIGKAVANAIRKSGIVQHVIYSSMPDHSVHDPAWPALPLWTCKFTVENYIRQLGLPSTFVYAGIYNNNFTSLPYPLFCMEFKDDETLEWKAPFPPDTKLPWLDAEHDVGPAVLQILKDGPSKWNGHRIALAFESLTPIQVCQAFSRALERPCKYIFSPTVEIRVPIPTGYREQLAGIEVLFGQMDAPYFPGEEFDFQTPPPIKDKNNRRQRRLTQEARDLWPAYRGIEAYAREVFPVEEEANGKTWMRDKVVNT